MFAGMVRRIALLAGGMFALAFMPVAAVADSCWVHNGSLMRLKASGNQRAFYYEYPRQTMRGAGVTHGTLLFNGSNVGGRYSGTARVFSKYCPTTPLEYYVEGPVDRSQTRVTMRGRREVMERCQPTGRTTNDTLVFTYSHQC
ncbi:hypothetical protein [Rhizobium arsenicireducens]|jgi:hypothetical protein